MKLFVNNLPSKPQQCLFANRHYTDGWRCMFTHKVCENTDKCRYLKTDRGSSFLEKEFHIPKDFNAFKNDTIKLVPCTCGSTDNYGCVSGNPSLYYFRCNACEYETEHFPTVKEAADYWNKEHAKPYTPYDYQVAAGRTRDHMLSTNGMLLEGLVGINSEAGEALDIWKKYEFHKHDLDAKAIALELGDVLWYLTEAAVALGYSLEDIMKMNIEKLNKRYPNGFDPEISKNREV